MCPVGFVIRKELSLFEMYFLRLWSKRNVLFSERNFFEMWYKWNVSCLECAIFGLCSFWNVTKMECAFFGMCFFEMCSSSMWYLWIYNFLSFFFILWVEPSTFYVSNHLEKGFLCHSWELFYLFTFAAIYSQLQATKKNMHGMNLKFIEKISPKTLVKSITGIGWRQCLLFSSWQ